MDDHFLIASWSRDVVISGELEPMREPLMLLANYRYDQLKVGGWLPWIAQLQAAARLTASAQSLDAAAMGVATMSRICGECHRASDDGPSMAAPPPRAPAARREQLPVRMLRHMRASTLLWEGLTAPSDVAWAEGVHALESAPAELDRTLPPQFDADLREIQALGEQAANAVTLENRADVFGLLLATCADCHRRWLEHGP